MEKQVFNFKQFKIIQNPASVFKVNTEAILLTAWSKLDENVNSILEIGCGTGVISLGLVQRLSCQVNFTAIDINPEAVNLTKLNCEENQITNITTLETSLQDLSLTSNSKFDFIISNPPYFHTAIQSTKTRNIQAKYTDSLSFRELIFHSARLLNPLGRIALIIPFDNLNEIIKLASQSQLILSRQCNIFTSHKKKALRALIEFQFTKSEIQLDKLYLKDDEGNYSEKFKTLTKEYYSIF